MIQGTELFSLEGKTSLVTGATGYLGRAMARVLAEAGAVVYINSRSKEAAESFVAELQSDGWRAEPAVFDVTNSEAVIEYFNQFDGRALNILINNAYAGGSGKLEQSTAGSYADSYDVSVVAAHRIFTAALINLRKAVEMSGDASVINVGSMYGMVSPDQRIYEIPESVNPPFYGAAKAALIHWSRYAACEFGKEGIRVNSLSPGAFPSKIVQKESPDFVKSLESKIPVGHIGQANDVRGPALFLASSASRYVNGANIVVDGGWTCW